MTAKQLFSTRTIGLARSLGMAAAISICSGTFAARAETATPVPAPMVDSSTKSQAMETAILAGGCFWGVQGVFQHVEGVTSAVSGYAGGSEASASYDAVSSGSTAHAEAVRVTFDPTRISYGRLLQIYFSVAHDPTELNRQGPDRGTQYRSTIFPTGEEQARVARAYIDQLGGAHVFRAAIATTIETGRRFYAAEAYHQNFLAANPTHPYIVVNDLPKVADLKRLFPERFRSSPRLVADARSTN